MDEFKELKNVKGPFIVDSSEKEPVYMIAVNNKNYINLNKEGAFLIQGIKDDISLDSIAEKLTELTGDYCTREKIIDICQSYTKELKELNSKNIKNISIFSKNTVYKISLFFSSLFHPYIALPLLLAGTYILYMLFNTRTFNFYWFYIFIFFPYYIVLPLFIVIKYMSTMSFDFIYVYISYNSLWVFVLYMFSNIMHEIGHASSCVYFGVKPGEIRKGIGCFLCDVGFSWNLNRTKRVIVDISGFYFQLLTGCLYYIIFLLSGWEPLKISVYFIIITCIFSIIPNSKNDSYYAISDALGVLNFNKTCITTLRYFKNKLFRQETQELPWPKRIGICALLYLIFCFTFVFYLVIF